MPLTKFLFMLLTILNVSRAAIAAADGTYSKLATPVSVISGMSQGLPSPEGLSVIHAKEVESSNDDSGPFKVWVTRSGHSSLIPMRGFVGAEVEWSPDSAAFFLTYSDTGAVGQYHLLVYRRNENGFTSIEPIPDGSNLFKPHCLTPGPPNVGGIQWGRDSNTILVAVEVPPTSDCASQGTFRAFEIALPGGKVLITYDQLEAKKQFRDSLGKELVNADDDCVRKRKTCVPPGLKLPSTPKRRPN
jgi:hypothetical protein